MFTKYFRFNKLSKLIRFRQFNKRYFSKFIVPFNKKNTIIPKIDEILDSGSKSYVEIINAQATWQEKISKYRLLNRSTGNPYGHAVILISLPTWKYGIVYNINKPKKDRMVLVEKHKVHNYLFNPNNNSDQIIKDRTFAGIRIPATADQVNGIHKFFTDLQKDYELGKKDFHIASFLVPNILKPFFNLQNKHNCANYTSQALKEVKLVDSVSNFPLFLWFKILVEQVKQGKDVDIITYNAFNHKDKVIGSFLYPFYWLKHAYSDIWNLNKFANIKVTSDLEKNEFIIKEVDKRKVVERIEKVVMYLVERGIMK